MSFNYSSGVITQSGTDANLSGLSGLTGVTTKSYQEHTIYELDYQLKITGNLTHNANEYLEFSATGPSLPILVNGGNYVIYGYIANEDLSNNLGRPQILALKTPLYSWSQNYGFRINGNSSVILNGAYIKINGALNTMTLTSNFTANLGCYEGGTASDGNLSMFRAQFGGNIDVNGFIALNMTNALTQSTTLSLDDFSPRQNQEGLLITTGSNFSNYKTINNYNPLNCVKDVGYFGGSLYLVYGFPNVAPKCGAHINRSTPTGEGRFELRKIINFTIKDLSGSNVSGAKIFMSDTNQPTTRDYSRSNYTSLITGNQILTEETYLQQTAADGTASIDKILAYNAMYATENVGNNSSPVENLYKTKASDHEYKDDAFVCRYSFQINKITDIDLTGLNQKNVESVLLPDTSITEQNKATVSAYPITVSVVSNTINVTGDNTTVQNLTSAQLYDFLAAYIEDHFGTYTEFLVTRSGSEINATGYNVNLSYINYTGDMVTDQVITLSNGSLFNGVRTDANGTVNPDQPISITNISAGSRLRIYNVTTGVETVNTVVSGTSYTSSYQEGTGYNDGDTVRVYLTKLGKEEWVGDVIDTSSGFNVLASQVDDDVYTALSVDGSTVIKFQADYVNNEVDLIIGSDWTMAELYAWWSYNLTTEDGIRNFFGGITAIDQANFKINTSIVDLYLDNTTNASYRQTDNRRFFRDTGDGYPVRNPTTSGYGLDVVWRNTILIAQTEAGGTSDLNFYDVKRAVKQVITNPKYIKGQK